MPVHRGEVELLLFLFQLFKRIAAALPGMDAGNEKNNEDLIEVRDKTRNLNFLNLSRFIDFL